MAELILTEVEFEDFIDVLFPFLEREDALEVEVFSKSNGEEESNNVTLEDLTNHLEENFLGNSDVEYFGIKVSKLLCTFTLTREELKIDYPDEIQSKMRDFESLRSESDYDEEIAMDMDEDN